MKSRQKVLQRNEKIVEKAGEEKKQRIMMNAGAPSIHTKMVTNPPFSRNRWHYSEMLRNKNETKEDKTQCFNNNYSTFFFESRFSIFEK